MPGKNIVKIYAQGGYYHVYNRGVEQRTIFLDDQDYKVFLHFLKIYLSPPEPPLEGSTLPRVEPSRKCFYGQIELLAYCLMPNHFHLLLHQNTTEAMTEFMRCVSTSYAMYFNKKYQRVGSLFQGTYKATYIDKDPYLLHLSRYIHLNPYELPGVLVEDWPYSSYGDYLGSRHTAWVKKDFILSLFASALNRSPGDMLSYQSFVKEGKDEKPGSGGMHGLEYLCLDWTKGSTLGRVEP